MSGTLTVGFEFYQHTDMSQPPLGVILAQEGGPGYSTTGSRDGYVRLFTPLRDRRDILLVDKRGTGRSSAIDCAALQMAYLPDMQDVAACGKQLGATAWFYRSADAANDVAAVLGALQVGPVDYYGDSYGTWFGEVFAVLHPGSLRTMVLDSAYPVLGDNSNSEVNHGQQAMEIACHRSRPCRELGGSAQARFAALLAALRAKVVSGAAPGANGETRHVTADPGGLFLIVANAGNAPTTWRDLDAAGRAWMENGYATPLLRLVAEARDSYSGGGSYKEFSVGLADAVQCAEYGTNFNLHANLARRLEQYATSISRLQQNHPDAYAPFTFDAALFSQMDAEEYDTCLPWPKPVEAIVPGDFPLALGDRLRDEGSALTVDDDAVESRRRAKAAAELEGIRAAQRAAEAAMTAAGRLLARAQPTDDGGLEVDGEHLRAEDVRATLRPACAQAGAPCPPDVIVASLWSGYGHDPGSGPLPSGLPIVVDIWPRDERSSCWADMTRTFLVGVPVPEHAELIGAHRRLVETALERAKTAIRPGITGRELFDMTCDLFESEGHLTQRTAERSDEREGFQFSLGHGVGLEVHEAPSLGLTGHAPLVAGDVLAIEPGLWDPTVGEVRFEDLVLVTDDGCETLTRFPL